MLNEHCRCNALLVPTSLGWPPTSSTDRAALQSTQWVEELSWSHFPSTQERISSSAVDVPSPKERSLKFKFVNQWISRCNLEVPKFSKFCGSVCHQTESCSSAPELQESSFASKFSIKLIVSRIPNFQVWISNFLLLENLKRPTIIANLFSNGPSPVKILHTRASPQCPCPYSANPC